MRGIIMSTVMGIVLGEHGGTPDLTILQDVETLVLDAMPVVFNTFRNEIKTQPFREGNEYQSEGRRHKVEYEERDPDYEHHPSIRCENLDSIKEAHLAVTRARKLATDLGLFWASGKNIKAFPCSDAMSARKDQRKAPLCWLIDTGCGFDLLSKSQCEDWTLASAQHLTQGICLNTANGQTRTTSFAEVPVAPLEDTPKPLLLEGKSPAVLSVGYRCMTKGYSFHWPAGKRPYFVQPSGSTIHFRVEGYIPYLDEADPAESQAAAAREMSCMSEDQIRALTMTRADLSDLESTDAGVTSDADGGDEGYDEAVLTDTSQGKLLTEKAKVISQTEKARARSLQHFMTHTHPKTSTVTHVTEQNAKE